MQDQHPMGRQKAPVDGADMGMMAMGFLLHLESGMCRKREHEGHRDLDLVLHLEAIAVHVLCDVPDSHDREGAEGSEHSQGLGGVGVDKLPAAREEGHRLSSGAMHHRKEVLGSSN